jgi:hypothetical protein
METAPGADAAVAAAVATGSPAAVAAEDGCSSLGETTVSGSPAAVAAEDGCSSLGETTVSGTSKTSSWDRDAECWICREDGRNERLIRPCLCRGSMSGVHRSCVETWVASQLESGGANATAPRCPVCHQEYRGDTAQPGVVAFGRSFCRDIVRQALRCVLLIAVLSGYWVAAQEGEGWGLNRLWRPALLVCTGAFFSYKLLVMLLSLPLADEPPTGWRRLFTVATSVDLGGLLGESLASTAIVVLWWVCDMMDFRYVLPILAFAVLTFGRMTTVYCDHVLLAELARSSSSVLVQAFHAAKNAMSHPCSILSAADVGIHVIAATVAFVIVVTCRDEDPLVIFLVAHCIVLFACLVENMFIRRLRWKAGKRWLLLIQLGMFVTYSANLLCEILPGLVATPASWRVFACSAVWLSLISVLSVTVNRAIFLEYYTSWQQHHGKFRLGRSPKRPHRQKAARQPRPPPDSEGGLAGGAGSSSSAAATEHVAAPAAAAEAPASEEDHEDILYL